MTTTSPAWQQAAASILLSYTLRGALLSFLYLVLPATLRADGMSLTFTALSSLVFLPVGLTWLWSTAIDRNPGSGRRRWITGALLVAAAAFGVMAMLDPVADYAAVLTAAMIVAAAAATIATATDAAIIDGVPVVYRGWANALQPTGVALGGLAIAGVGSIYARHGWTVAALSMAAAASVAAVILRTVPQIVARSQSAPAERPAPRFALLRDPSARRALAVVIVSRAGIHLPMGIFAAFQIDAGLSVATVALVGDVLGAAAGLTGSALGGLAATYLTPLRAVQVALASVAMAGLALALSTLLKGVTPANAIALALLEFLVTPPVFVAMHRQFMLAPQRVLR